MNTLTPISPYSAVTWTNNQAPNIEASLLNGNENSTEDVVELANLMCGDLNEMKNNRLILSVAERTSIDNYFNNPSHYANVQADWNQTTTKSDDYIKNKPLNLVQDATYTTKVHDRVYHMATGANRITCVPSGTGDTTLATLTIYSYDETKAGTEADPKETFETIEIKGDVDVDTKNTAGATNLNNIEDKFYLVGATQQSANPQTYTRSNSYITNNGFFINGAEVATIGGTQSLINKTYNGLNIATDNSSGITLRLSDAKQLVINGSYTLNTACARGVDVNPTADSANLLTSGGAYTAFPQKTLNNSFSGINDFTNLKIKINFAASSGEDYQLYEALNACGMLDACDTITFNLYIGTSTSTATSCTAALGQTYDKWAISTLNTTTATAATGGSGTTGTITLVNNGTYRLNDDKILSQA